MSKKLQLHIPEPCHEDWNKMSPVDKGRFCNSCQKAVVDFYRMTDEEVFAFFHKPSTGSVCGRLTSDQLDKEFRMPQKRLPWLKYFFQFFIPVFLTSIKASSQGLIGLKPKMEQVGNFNTNVVDRFQSVAGMVIPHKSSSSEINIVKGKVEDEKGNPIANASIIIKGTKTGVSSDSKGEYEIKFRQKGNVTLVITSVGFEFTERLIDPTRENELLITLKEAGQLYGVIIYTPKKKPEKVPLFTKIFRDTVYRDIKIYPNPVESGAQLHVEFKKAEPGDYQYYISNEQGQRVHQSTISFVNKKDCQSLTVPTLTPGVYIITLVNKKNSKKYTEKIVVN